jgi:BTB/POZ domain
MILYPAAPRLGAQAKPVCHSLPTEVGGKQMERQQQEEEGDRLDAWTEHQVVLRARVGDRQFRIGKRVIQAAGPHSLLREFIPATSPKTSPPEVFFDRSARSFAAVLEYLRTGTVPPYSRALLLEALYFRIERLVRALRARQRPKRAAAAAAVFGPVPHRVSNAVFSQWLVPPAQQSASDDLSLQTTGTGPPPF